MNALLISLGVLLLVIMVYLTAAFHYSPKYIVLVNLATCDKALCDAVTNRPNH